MRDIKCRAFSISMGTYFKDHNGNTRYFVAGDGTELFTTDIVEMFTGLKDMTGKEIYEGDIVWHDAIYKAVEVTYGLQHVDAFEGYGFNLWSHYGDKQDGSRIQSELKVIGNIHERKEVTKLFIYRVEIWYRHGDNEKEFMHRTILSPTDQRMEELARQIRPNVFKVEIKSKEEYGKVRE